MIQRTMISALLLAGLAACAAPDPDRPYIISNYPGDDVVIGMPEKASVTEAEQLARFACTGVAPVVTLDRVEDDRRIYRCIDTGADVDWQTQ